MPLRTLRENRRAGVSCRSAAYYLNNTAKARSVLECAVRQKINHFVFSSTAAVYVNPKPIQRITLTLSFQSPDSWRSS